MHYAVNRVAKNEDSPSVLMAAKGLTDFVTLDCLSISEIHNSNRGNAALTNFNNFTGKTPHSLYTQNQYWKEVLVRRLLEEGKEENLQTDGHLQHIPGI